MKQSTLFLLAVIVFLAFSCRNNDTGSETNPAPTHAHVKTLEIKSPQLLLIYPSGVRADSMKKRMGDERYHELYDQNASYFNELRCFLKNAGIRVSVSEQELFRFVSADGIETHIDLSGAETPWQVIIFSGSGTPVLAPPYDAIRKVREIFSIEEKKQPKKGLKTGIRTSNEIPENYETGTTSAGSDSEPMLPLIRETRIRLLLPYGSKPPLNRDETSEYRVVTSYINPVRHFGLAFENDIFSNTDRYYTNGIMLNFTAPGLVGLPVNRLMIPAGDNSIVHATLSLNHAMYTPFTTKNPPLLDGDRPYASTLFIRYSQTSANDVSGTLLTSGIDIGVIGDAALGRYFQSSVHATVPTNDEPLGWETQIQNDPVFNYSASINKRLMQSPNAELFASASIAAGTLQTGAGMGIDFITGVFAPVLTPLPKTYSELLPAFGRWQYGFKGGIGFRFVGYNATLQGGLFNTNNIYTLKPEEIERMVAAIHLGMFVRYRKFGIDLSQHYLSPEFKTGKNHFWGRIGLEYVW